LFGENNGMFVFGSGNSEMIIDIKNRRYNQIAKVWLVMWKENMAKENGVK